MIGSRLRRPFELGIVAIKARNSPILSKPEIISWWKKDSGTGIFGLDFLEIAYQMAMKISVAVRSKVKDVI